MQKAKVALEVHGSYIASCNLYWLDMWKNPAPGVPLSRDRIAALAKFYFPDDRNNNFFQKLLEVQVDVGALTEKPSGLVVISPLEIIHAIVLKAAEQLGRDGVTAACKDSWKQALLLAVQYSILSCLCMRPFLGLRFKKFVELSKIGDEDSSASSDDSLQ